MRYQRQSEVPKKGNPEDHEQAVKNVVHFLKENGKGEWFYWKEWVEQFNEKFNKTNKLRSDYGHSYDIAIMPLYRENLPSPILYIEVNGEKHTKKGQQINDGLAEKYIKEVLLKEIIRLDKVECLGKVPDRYVYFREKLRKYIK